MRATTVNPATLRRLRGKRSREVIAHELRVRGHATDAKAIWRWENRRNQPSARVLPDYAEVLGAPSLEALYGDDDEEEDALSGLTREEQELLDRLSFEQVVAYKAARAAAAGRVTDAIRGVS